MNQLITNLFTISLSLGLITIGNLQGIERYFDRSGCRGTQGNECDFYQNKGYNIEDKKQSSTYASYPYYAYPYYYGNYEYYGFPSLESSDYYSYPSYGQYDRNDGGIDILHFKFR
jgi:hypothetical protein